MNTVRRIERSSSRRAVQFTGLTTKAVSTITAL
jgi:hypothetical protein